MYTRKLILRIKSNSLLRDSIWAVLGNILGKGTSFTSGVIVARILGKVTFGEYSAILATVISASVFSTFGLGYTATKFIAETKNKSKNNLRTLIYYSRIITFVTSLAVAVFVFIFSEQLALKIFGSINLSLSFKIVSLLVIFNASTTTQTGVLAGLGCFKEMARINTTVGVLTFLFSVTGAWFFGLNGLLLATLCIQGFSWFLNSRQLQAELINLPNELQRNRKVLAEIIKFSTPIALQEALFSITSWTLPYLLIRFSGVSELGLYTASTQLSALILFIPGVLRNVYLSHLAKTDDVDSKRDSVFKTTICINIIITTIPFIFVFLLISFISDFYGSEFVGIDNLILISSATAVIMSINNVYSQAYLSKGKSWLVFWLRFLRDIVLVLGFIVLVSSGLELRSSALLLILVLVVNIILLGSYLYFSALLNPKKSKKQQAQ